MWKYVSRRIKDTAEQTCSNIKNLRSTFSTCSIKPIEDVSRNQSVRRYETTSNGRTFNIWRCLGTTNCVQPKENAFNINGPYISQKCYEKQKQKKEKEFDRFMDLGFYRLTAGFLCCSCIYFCQLICLHTQRRENLKQWKLMEKIWKERSYLRSLPINETIYQRSYVPSNNEAHWYDAGRKPKLLGLVPVSNDHSNETDSNSKPLESPKHAHEQNVRLAVDDLLATLGSIEFRLGVQNLRADEPEAAVTHFKSGTTHRHPQAAYNLGVCYELGKGVTKSMEHAVQCYRAAANLGHKTAMYNLAVCYIHGRGGLKKNYRAAEACLEAASRLGLPEAKRALEMRPKSTEKDEDISWKSTDKSGAMIHSRVIADDRPFTYV